MDAKEVLDFNDLDRRTITIKKWGGQKLGIQEMTAEERVQMLKVAAKGDEEFDSEIIAEQSILFSVRDPKTWLPFFDAKTIKGLKKKSWHAIRQISKAVMEINGLGDKALADAEKNLSGDTPS